MVETISVEVVRVSSLGMGQQDTLECVIPERVGDSGRVTWKEGHASQGEVKGDKRCCLARCMLWVESSQKRTSL